MEISYSNSAGGGSVMHHLDNWGHFKTGSPVSQLRYGFKNACPIRKHVTMKCHAVISKCSVLLASYLAK